MPKPKLLLIGWDGDDWKVISALLNSRLIPTLNSFNGEGVMGSLATLPGS
jgi:predicted AlkP superfamily phosphohydrolase/phosphomutase